jgi:uncharacterized C2H2 Zn-finger protein
MKNPLRQLYNHIYYWKENRKWLKCPYCGGYIKKKTAIISGGPGYAFGYHIHCPSCGKIAAYNL